MSDAKNRQSLLLPLLVPVACLTAIGAVLFGFSRVLLALTPVAAWVTAMIVAIGIMASASYVASRRSVGGGSVVSMVGAAAGIAMLAGGVALIAAAKGSEVEHPVLPRVLIVAPPGAATAGYAEETRQVTAPAGKPFEIRFDNEDTEGQPHNVVIASSTDPGATTFLEQPPFVGPKVMTWKVDPLAEGSYVFFCRVHPTVMTGTLTAASGGGAITVVAQSLRFDTNEIDLPTGVASTIVLENRDADTHNLSIYRDQGYTDAIVQKPPFAGPGRQTYQVPSLEAGTYFFRCDVHPPMAGTVVVASAGGSGASPSPAEPTGGG